MKRRRALSPDAYTGEPAATLPKGHDNLALGPSDSSDSGSDLRGSPLDDPDMLDSTSDREGTGERSSAGPHIREAADISPDRVIEASQAGLGGGLDQAEEAQFGITDEELEALARSRGDRRE